MPQAKRQHEVALLAIGIGLRGSIKLGERVTPEGLASASTQSLGVSGGALGARAE
jgi:hypothetical protein